MKTLILFFLVLAIIPSAFAQSATVNWNTTHQTIDGFAGATIGSGNQTEITGQNSSLFFSPTSGIGLSYIRTGNTSDGSIPDRLSLQAAVANGAKVFLTMSSPPASLKQSGSFSVGTASSNGTCLRSDQLLATSYSAYATYIVDLIKTYQGSPNNIPIELVSVQNEPDVTVQANSNVTVGSCIFTSQAFHDLTEVLGPALAAAGLTTKIMLPELSEWFDQDKASTCLTDSACSKYVTGDPAALRAIPADAVVGGIAMGVGQPATFAGPMVDGTILTEPYEEAFAKGHIARVPLIIGTNDYESKVFEAGLDYGALLERLGAAKDTVLAAYKAAYADEADRKTRFMTEMMYFEPTRFLARQMAKSGQPSYFYRFSYVAEGLRGKVMGALHASEMPYVFDNLPAAPETSMSKVWLDALYAGSFSPTARDRAVAKAMNAYWIGFAKTGDPNGAGRPHWTSVSADPDAILEVDAEGPRGVTDPVKARLDAFEPMNAPGWR